MVYGLQDTAVVTAAVVATEDGAAVSFIWSSENVWINRIIAWTIFKNDYNSNNTQTQIHAMPAFYVIFYRSWHSIQWPRDIINAGINQNQSIRVLVFFLDYTKLCSNYLVLARIVYANITFSFVSLFVWFLFFFLVLPLHFSCLNIHQSLFFVLWTVLIQMFTHW